MGSLIDSANLYDADTIDLNASRHFQRRTPRRSPREQDEELSASTRDDVQADQESNILNNLNKNTLALLILNDSSEHKKVALNNMASHSVFARNLLNIIEENADITSLNIVSAIDMLKLLSDIHENAWVTPMSRTTD